MQWGDPDGKKPVGAAQRTLAAEFERPAAGPDAHAARRCGHLCRRSRLSRRLPRGRRPGAAGGPGWCTATAWSGAGRDNDVDSGGGTELYVVIGQAPRHLDRNVTLLGRVVQGMELLSVLPRGTGAWASTSKPEQRVPIKSVARGRRRAGGPAHRTRGAAHRHAHLCAPTLRRVATGTRSGSRCPPGTWTCATCRCRCAARGAEDGKVAAADAAALQCRCAGRIRPRRVRRVLRTRVIDHFPPLRRGGVAPALPQHLALLPAAAAESGGSSAALWLAACGGSDWKCCQRPRSAWRCSGGSACQRWKRSCAWLRCSGRHAQPALAAARQRLLPLRRQGAPLVAELRQQLLLLRRQALTRYRRGGGGRRGRRCGRRPAAQAPPAAAPSSEAISEAPERQSLFLSPAAFGGGGGLGGGGGGGGGLIPGAGESAGRAATGSPD